MCPSLLGAVAATAVVILSVATLPGAWAQSATCGDNACLVAQLAAAGHGVDAPFVQVELDVGGACSTVACAGVSPGGPLVFSLTGSNASHVCCSFAAYRNFLYGSAPTPAGVGAVRAVVFDALLSNASNQVGGLYRPLVRSSIDPLPVTNEFAVLGVTFMFSEQNLARSTTVATMAATSSVDGGASVPQPAANAQLQGNVKSVQIVLPSTSRARTIQAWSLRFRMPCDVRVDAFTPVALRVRAQDSGGAYDTTESVTAYCGVALAAAPVPSSSFTVTITRADNTALTEGEWQFAAAPITVDRIIQPANPSPQDTRVYANGTVLFLCPPGTSQQSSTVGITARPEGNVPLAQHAMSSMSIYALTTSVAARRTALYMAGIPPGPTLTSITLTAAPQIWGARASLMRTEVHASAPVRITDFTVLHGNQLTCVAPKCTVGTDDDIPVTGDAARGTQQAAMTGVQLELNRGNPCRMRFQCPAWAVNVIANVTLPAREVLRARGAPFPAHMSSGVPGFLGADLLDSSSRVDFAIDGGYYSRYFAAYPREWGIFGPLLTLDGRVYSAESAPGSLPDIGATVMCVAQPRCPTQQAVALPALATAVATGGPGGAYKWVGTMPDSMWPVNSSCRFLLQCANAAATLELRGGDRVVVEGIAAADVVHAAVRLNASIVALSFASHLGRTAPAVRIGVEARCVVPTATESVSLSESLEVPTPAPPAPATPPPTTTAATTAAPPPPTRPTNAPTSAPPVMTTAPPTAITLSTTPAPTAVSTTTAAAMTTTTGAPLPPTTTMPTTTTTTTTPTPTMPTTSTPPPAPSMPATTPPPAPPTKRTATVSRSLSETDTAHDGAAPPVVPGGGALASAADTSIDAATIGTYAGGTLLVAGIVGAAILGFPVLRRAWRRRRRSGDDDLGPAEPMRERTNQYRWYEDAEAVAGDIEARGEDIQRQDHEGLLHVPEVTTTTSTAADPFALGPSSAPAADGLLSQADLSSSLLSGSIAPGAAVAQPQRLNPLLASHAL